MDDERFNSGYTLNYKLIVETLKIDFNKNQRVSPIINKIFEFFDQESKPPQLKEINNIIKSQEIKFLKNFQEKILSKFDEENLEFDSLCNIFLERFEEMCEDKEVLLQLIKFIKNKKEKYHKLRLTAKQFVEKERVDCGILSINEEEIETYELDKFLEKYNSEEKKKKKLAEVVEVSSHGNNNKTATRNEAEMSIGSGNMLDFMREEINSESLMSPPRRAISGLVSENGALNRRKKKFFEPKIEVLKSKQVEEINLAVSDDIDEEAEDVGAGIGKRWMRKEKNGYGAKGRKKKKLKFL